MAKESCLYKLSQLKELYILHILLFLGQVHFTPHSLHGIQKALNSKQVEHIKRRT